MARRATAQQTTDDAPAVIETADETLDRTLDEASPVVAEPVEATKPKGRKVEPKPCACGCGEMTGGGRYRPGHDARHHGSLLRAFDAGDEAAGAELVANGWATEEGLVARKVDGPKARQAASAEERKAAKVARLDAKIAALVAERDALDVAGVGGDMHEAADIAFSTAAAEVEGWVDGIDEPDPAIVAVRCREAAGLFLTAAALHGALVASSDEAAA